MSESDRVALTVPARGEYARTVRLAAAELATRAGMDIDDVDDVKLAVEEAFVYAVARLKDADLKVAFTVDDSSIEVLVGPLPGPCVDGDEADAGERYAAFILAEVCDEFDILDREGACFLRLFKKKG
jgi:serine/threonine-protein kinase RsbW